MNGQFINLLHSLCFVDYSLGHTGSAHDSYAFQSTRIAKNPSAFLGPSDWIWVDSAYPIRRWCIPPFRKPKNGELTQSQRRFNYRLSTVRVRAEHAIGLLKGRFQSLRELRIQIGSHHLHKWAILWVCCCVILHNLIILFEEDITNQTEGENEDETNEGWQSRCILAGMHGACDGEEEDEAYDLEDDPVNENSNGNIDDEDDENPVPEVARAGADFRLDLLNKLLSSHLYM